MAETLHQLRFSDEQPARLDLFLARELSQFSRSYLAFLVREGVVRINGSVVQKASVRLSQGDRVDIRVPRPTPLDIEPEPIPLKIVYQDSDLAVVDKSPGIVIHPAPGHREGTLVHALLYHLHDLSGIGGELRPGIVHRLDRDTSGLMVVAKNDFAHHDLASQFKNRTVQKEYQAVCIGSPTSSEGVVDLQIGRSRKDPTKMAVGGRRIREARSEYRLVRRLGETCLVRVRIHTGRTHQIRVHLSSIHLPLAGDRVYGGKAWKGIRNTRARDLLSAYPRQALHSSSLGFNHPRDAQTLQFESELPEDLQELVDQLDAIYNP